MIVIAVLLALLVATISEPVTGQISYPPLQLQD